MALIHRFGLLPLPSAASGEIHSPSTSAFTFPDALKVITLRAMIGAPTPVFGLRPMRALFWRTANLPKPRRIAERRRLEQTPQVFQQRRILARQRQPSAAGASNVLRDDGRRQIAQPAIDGAARYSGRPRNSGYAAKPGRTRLRRRKQATPAFVESSAQSLIPLPNRCFINHAAVINQPMAARNPPGQIDSIISRHRLRSRILQKK